LNNSILFICQIGSWRSNFDSRYYFNTTYIYVYIGHVFVFYFNYRIVKKGYKRREEEW